MATLCTHCGKPLPREDARFCNNCGSFVSSQSSGVVDVIQNSTAAGKGQSAQSTHVRPVLREQVAFPPQQLSSRDTAASHRWTDQHDRALQSSPSLRRLRVKVWDEPSHAIKEEHTSVIRPTANVGEESALEDLPTSQLAIPLVEDARNTGDAGDADRLAAANDVELLETRPLQVQGNGPVELSQAMGTLQQQARQAQHFRPTQRPARQGQAHPTYPLQQPARPATHGNGYQGPLTPALPVSLPGLLPMPPATAPLPVASEPVQARTQTPARPAKRRRHVRLLVVAAALVLLLIAGGVVWVIEFQPFTVPSITNTSVDYQSSGLGFSLRYPQGWTAQQDTQHSSVSFFDANHTDQFNLTLASTNGQTIEQYSKKLIAQSGITGQKDLAPLTFAGERWQVVQGTALQSGASYTETLLVTTHGSHFYALLLMAPASTYADAEHLFFGPVRAAFQFL